MRTFFIPLLCLSLAGCGDTAQKPKDNAATPSLSMFPTAPVNPHDANPAPSLFVNLTVYRLALPAKSISHNEDFWKHVNEDDAVDVGTHELLFANGFRVGVAPRGDWDYFKKILELHNVLSQQTGSSGQTGNTIEMPLKEKILQQFITWFHPTNGLVGQVYDRSDNLMTIRFETVPKNPGDVRVTVTPLIRAERTELMYTVRNEIQELNFVQPEHLFDLKLSVDVPLDHFLIIAPSGDADLSTSLGRKFLYQQANGQEFEQVLLISPQPFQFEKKPTTGPATAPSAAK